MQDITIYVLSYECKYSSNQATTKQLGASRKRPLYAVYIVSFSHAKIYSFLIKTLKAFKKTSWLAFVAAVLLLLPPQY